MTGFGTGEAPGPGGRGRLAMEVRGVNHRFFDVRVRMPRELSDLGPFVEHLAREHLGRGRFEIGVRTDGLALGAPLLDKDRAKEAYRALCELRDEVAPGTPVPLSMLTGIADLFVSAAERAIDDLRESLRRAFEEATASLDAMRIREGQAIASDLARRLDVVHALSRRVAERAPDIVDGHRRRLRERTERLRATLVMEVDAGRLEQEVALLADRSDVTEEVTRLESHCAQFKGLLASPEAVGRRLDFLLQEMAREANTAGAKCADAQVSHLVVEIKAELERMREQVQNVE